MQEYPIRLFLFEDEWYITFYQGEVKGNTIGPFQTKEDAVEWYQANQTKQCPNCED